MYAAAERKCSCTEAFLSTQIKTNGGDKETDVNELAVRPCGEPSAASTAATVIPVAKAPQAWRNNSGEKGRETGTGVSLDNFVTLILSSIFSRYSAFARRIVRN